jgi:salicylate hydroxylase
VPQNTKLRVAIVGAGIGGLTLGLLLKTAGYPVQIFEQAHVLGEVGAGLTLSKGAQATLGEAGVLEDVKRAALISAAIPFLHYKTAARLAGDYDRSDGAAQPDAPVGRQIHRADLHSILAAKFATIGGELFLGHRLIGIEEGGARLRFEGRDDAVADLLVGADGLRSAVRSLLLEPSAPIFTNQVAWRFLIPTSEALPYMSAGRAAVYFGPGKVINRYTLRKGEVLNCVALARTEGWFEEGWSVQGDPAEMLQLYDGWHEDVVGLMRLATPQTLRRWGLYHRDPLPFWRTGRATLLGDAAHPMLPFLGLGAAMAIEDAMVLTRALAQETDLEAALELYEAARKPRTAEVYRQSIRQGELLQSRDPDAFDGAAAPASDRTFYDYDPVTAPLA